MIRKLFYNFTKRILKYPFYNLYKTRLASEAKSWKLPNHIGIILDGNRRYARDLGLKDIIQGHEKGADKLYDVLTWCFDMGIPVVTIWTFSLDNFSREQSEVEGILKLIEKKTIEYRTRDEIHRNRVKVRYIGKLELLRRLVAHRSGNPAHLLGRHLRRNGGRTQDALAMHVFSQVVADHVTAA